MNQIKFKGKEYWLKEVYSMAEDIAVLVSSTSLEADLFNDDGSYVSDIAEEIDSQIFFYCNEEEQKLVGETVKSLNRFII